MFRKKCCYIITLAVTIILLTSSSSIASFNKLQEKGIEKNNISSDKNSNNILLSSSNLIIMDNNISGLYGNETHPTLAMDSNGVLFGAYEYDQDNKIKWIYSEDNGLTWNIITLSNVNKKLPAVAYWGLESRFFSTFVPPMEDNNGGDVTIIEYNHGGSFDSKTFGFSDHGMNNMTDVDIACDYSQENHEFGVMSLVMSTTLEDGPVTNGPFLFFIKPDDINSAYLMWDEDYSNCGHTRIDIDQVTDVAYGVYDWFNDSKWSLLIQVLDFENPVSGYNETFEIDGIGDLTYPAVSAYNKNLVIVAETDDAGNKDIICKYSDNGSNNGEFLTSTVINTIDDETFPEIEWVNGETFICTFLRDNNLFACISNDGGATWEEPLQVNDKDGTVINEYKSSDLCEHGLKSVWEYHNGIDRDILIGDALKPETSTIKGSINDSEGNPLEDVKITVINNDWDWWQVSTFTNSSGGYTINVIPGVVSISAEKVGYETSSTELTVEDKETLLWNATLNELPIYLKIGPFNGGFGFSVSIKNMGFKELKNVTWNITVEGKRRIFGKSYITGNISSLKGQFSTIIDTGLLIGFGPVNVTVKVRADETFPVTRYDDGFLIGFWLTFFKIVDNPLKK